MEFQRADDARRLFFEMPKPELHLHLDGSLDPALALELAATRNVDAPRDWAGMRTALVAPERCADQADLLRAFDLPIALLQDAEALDRAPSSWCAARRQSTLPTLRCAGGHTSTLQRGSRSRR